jgi:hypothetical protein
MLEMPNDNAPAPELLSCPFCNGEASIHKDTERGTMPLLFRPQCRSCGCSPGGFDTKQQAVDFWNTRIPPAPAPSEREAELEKALREYMDKSSVFLAVMRGVSEVRPAEPGIILGQLVDGFNNANKLANKALEREGEE